MCRACFAILSSYSEYLFDRLPRRRAFKRLYLTSLFTRRSLVSAFACVLFFASTAPLAKSQGVLSAFEQQALLAFNPSAKVLNSITLTGNVVWTSGSLKEKGTVVLKASADGSTSETWTLPTQSYSQTTAALQVGRNCSLTDHAGAVHVDASPNCLRAVPWFAPWMGVSLISGTSVLGSDTSLAADLTSGTRKLNFQTSFSIASSAPAASTNELTQLETRTAVTVSYDLLTAMPSALSFVQVLDSDPGHVLPYQIVFSDFRIEGGYIVPHRIQRYIQRTLQADITITSATAE